MLNFWSIAPVLFKDFTSKVVNFRPKQAGVTTSTNLREKRKRLYLQSENLDRTKRIFSQRYFS